MFEGSPALSVNTVADIVRIAVAPVFLLSGIASFVNVCTTRMSRIVDRARSVEPLLLGHSGIRGGIDRALYKLFGALPATPVLRALRPGLVHAHFGRGGKPFPPK